MKKRIVMFFTAVMVVISAQANTWTDPDTGYTWTYTVSGDTVQIGNGSYSSSNNGAVSPLPTDNLTIPSEINGKTVTGIGNFAFNGCSGLTGALTIPGSVLTIGDSAFRGCSGLTGSLTLGNSVMTIGRSAFEGCSGFTGSLTLGNSVTNINDYAFEGCSGLIGSLTLGNNVMTIGYRAFYGCRLTGSLTIPSSVVLIGESAFENASGFNGTLTIESGVQEIGSCAFKNCSGFTGALTIPSSVMLIGGSAFEGDSGFNGTLTIESGVQGIGSCAFKNCSGFTGSLTIPGSVKKIGGGHRYSWGSEGEGAFEGCSGFTGALTIESGVVEIGQWAFKGCIGFTDVSLPETIESIYQAFYYDTGIKAVTIAEGSTIVGGFYGCTGLTEVEIPDSVTNIDAYAFSDCQNLVSFNMPTSIKVIGEYAFHYCLKLQKLEWMPGVTVGAGAFSYCRSWQGVFTVPEGVTEIAESVFEDCRGLRQIDLPNSVTRFGKRAFCGCESLVEINIPSGLEEIGFQAFASCRNLLRVEIPDTVKRIDDHAFEQTALSEFKIPYSVISLGSEVFRDTRISTITVPSTLVDFSGDAFLGVKNVIFEGELPAEWAREWLATSWGMNVAFPRSLGGQGFEAWPVTQFMGYTQTNAPTVTIVSSKIRENNPEVMDIVFKVNSTKPTVKVRALAFEDGVRSFAKVVRPQDFIADLEGNETKGNIGDAVTANVEHTLSWKVSSDWATRLAKVSFEVLAVEDDILPLELMTIPGTPAHPETWQISWNYITTDMTFEALLWLYADKDLGLTLERGVLRNGDTRLCSEDTVSAYDALVYVYGKMGFTLLDGDALDYVREATRLNQPDKSVRQYAYRVLTPAGE